MQLSFINSIGKSRPGPYQKVLAMTTMEINKIYKRTIFLDDKNLSNSLTRWTIFIEKKS